MKRLMMAVAAALAAGMGFAEPTITDVTARQRYPWNGLVDIVVTIKGDTNEIAQTECAFVATNSATQAAVKVATVSQVGADAFSDGVCTLRFLWDAATDVGEMKLNDLELTAGVLKKLGGVQLWENGPYWAECNVGASQPEEYGYYFWWGDTVGYKREGGTWTSDNYYSGVTWVSSTGTSMTSSPFDLSACSTVDMDDYMLQSLGYVDSAGNLVAAHDAATAHLGTPWRMPTSAEIDALGGNCTTTWTMRNGVRGQLVTGKGDYASKSIFLPAAGYGYGSSLYYTDLYGYYWSTTWSITPYYHYNAWFLLFAPCSFSKYSYCRYYGRSVRPLRETSAGVVGEGMTTSLKLDCRVGVRTCLDEGETFCYDASWYDGGSSVRIIDNGVVVTNGIAGTCSWSPDPSSISLHILTFEVLSAEGQILGAETSQFLKPGLDYAVTEVSARQRYPWNGLVDIVVTIQGDTNEIAQTYCTFAATNSATQVAVKVATVSQVGADAFSDGVCTRRFLWDAAMDVGEVKIDDLALTVDVQKNLGGVQLWADGPYWAECNVGASQSEEYGYYFWWGDTVGYKRNASNNGWVSVKDGSSYSFDDCPTYGKGNSTLQSLGYIDSTGNLVAAHDAATAHLGAPWRMPTDAEFSALISNCTTTWTTRNGVYGRLVTGKGDYASKSIFLPAAGFGYGSCLAGSLFGCWSSTQTSVNSNFAWSLFFDSSNFYRYYNNRDYGQSVRPLREFANDDSAVVVGATTRLKLDCQSGARRIATEQVLTYSTYWATDNVDAIATIAVNGKIIGSRPGAGSILWTPAETGTYSLTHLVTINGVQCGEMLTATFIAEWVPGSDVVVPIETTGGKSLTIPFSWFTEPIQAKFGTDLNAAALKTTGKKGADGAERTVWQEYVAGTDPTDANSQFTAAVSFEDGKPKVTWSPALNGEGVREGTRLYRVFGAKSLSSAFEEVAEGNESAYQFFKVTVEMP